MPTDTSFAKPSPRAAPRESSVPSIVPLCETRLVPPTGGASISSTAFTVSATRPGRSTMPMLFGPRRRTPSFLALSDNFRLALGAVGPGVGKAVAVDARHLHALARAILERRLDVLHHDEGVVDLPGRVGDAAVSALAKHLIARGVDRHDAAAIAVLAQIALRARGVLARIARGADERDAARREERLRQRHLVAHNS